MASGVTTPEEAPQSRKVVDFSMQHVSESVVTLIKGVTLSISEDRGQNQANKTLPANGQ